MKQCPFNVLSNIGSTNNKIESNLADTVAVSNTKSGVKSPVVQADIQSKVSTAPNFDLASDMSDNSTSNDPNNAVIQKSSSSTDVSSHIVVHERPSFHCEVSNPFHNPASYFPHGFFSNSSITGNVTINFNTYSQSSNSMDVNVKK